MKNSNSMEKYEEEVEYHLYLYTVIFLNRIAIINIKNDTIPDSSSYTSMYSSTSILISQTVRVYSGQCTMLGMGVIGLNSLIRKEGYLSATCPGPASM